MRRTLGPDARWVLPGLGVVVCAGGVEVETLVDVGTGVDLVEIVVGFVVVGLFGGLVGISGFENQDESEDQSSKKRRELLL